MTKVKEEDLSHIHAILLHSLHIVSSTWKTFVLVSCFGKCSPDSRLLSMSLKGFMSVPPLGSRPDINILQPEDSRESNKESYFLRKEAKPI